MGDGSATRSDKAPGSLHPLAHDFDEQVITALRTGDPSLLAHLDQAIGAEVQAAGTQSWRAVGRAVGEVDQAYLDFCDDPYSVLYLVARWRAQWASPA